MAQETDENTKRKPRRGEKAATWLLTGMLIVGLGGFGANSFTSQITTVGRVGETVIPAQDYARTVQSQMNEMSRQFGTSVSKTDALAMGVDRQALATLVTRAAMDEAARLALISAGDTSVAAELIKQSSFTGASGTFDRTIYRDSLKRNGWRESEYEEALRRDVARALLQGAVSGGFLAPTAASQALHTWITERRSFDMIRLDANDLQLQIETPSEEVLKAFYDKNLALFTRPDAKKIAIVALTPDMLLDEHPIDEAVLRDMYQARISEFVTPERRLVDRLVYPDQASVEEALARINAGSTFEAEVEQRGLPMNAVEMGDVARADLGSNGDAIFAAEINSVVIGDTDLGPALFRINGSLDGEEVTFEQARKDLAQEIQYDSATRAINDRIDEVDDLLAGGASLAELSKQIGMKYEEIIHVPGQQGDSAIAAYQAFRQAADKLQKGDFAETIMLDDGGVMAMEYLEALPAAPLPYEEIKDRVAQAWENDTLQTALSERASALKTQARNGTPLAELGKVESTVLVSRDGPLAQAPLGVLSEVFDMDAGELRIIEDGNFIALVQLNEINSSDAQDPESQMLQSAIDAQFTGSFEADALRAFSDAIGNASGIYLDQTAITAVNTSIP